MAEVRKYAANLSEFLVKRKCWRRRRKFKNRRRYLGKISIFGTYWWLTSEIENGSPEAIDFFMLSQLLRIRKKWALERRVGRDKER